MEKNKKKLKGIVVSDKMKNTVLVKIDILKTHPIYKKKIKWSNKYMAHNDKFELDIGDVVEIEESRPYSKMKKFKVTKNIKNDNKSE